MTVHVREILGTLDDERFATRRVERLAIGWAYAGRRRLRAQTDAGTDIAIDVQRGTYLADQAVLDDDGERVIAVVRTLEPALVLRFDADLSAGELVAQAARVGHAFGNQHAPIEVDDDGTIRVPLLAGEDVARRTVDALGLARARVTVEDVAFGSREPIAQGHAHG